MKLLVCRKTGPEDHRWTEKGKSQNRLSANRVSGTKKSRQLSSWGARLSCRWRRYSFIVRSLLEWRKEIEPVSYWHIAHIARWAEHSDKFIRNSKYQPNPQHTAPRVPHISSKGISLAKLGYEWCHGMRSNKGPALSRYVKLFSIMISTKPRTRSTLLFDGSNSSSMPTDHESVFDSLQSKLTIDMWAENGVNIGKIMWLAKLWDLFFHFWLSLRVVFWRCRPQKTSVVNERFVKREIFFYCFWISVVLLKFTQFIKLLQKLCCIQDCCKNENFSYCYISSQDCDTNMYVPAG